MNKKYLPWIALLAVALCFWFIKSKQRGADQGRATTGSVMEAYTALKEGNKTLAYSKHARCRMECRGIDESEVKAILESGTVNFSKTERDEKGVRYPMEGTTGDGQHVRIVFAPKENVVTVVTVIDLDNEPECNCS